MEKLGIGYDQLKEINSRLVYCSISGFGQDGPSRDKPGYDVLAQAMGGLMSCTGEPGGPPVKTGFAIADIGAGMWAAFGILAALMAREKTGLGQAVDTSLLEAQVSWHTYMAGNFFASGKNPRKLGSAHPNIVPYQAFSAKDQYFIVAVGNDSLWQKFCQIAGLEGLANDPRFVTNPKRVENRDELVRIIQARLLTKPAVEWVEALESAGIPAGLINDFDQVYQDPQVLHRQMVVEAEHPIAGKIRLTGIPVKLSGTPGQIRTAPPLLGQHTEEVLLSLGYSLDQIAELRNSGTL
jgi:formyl-CoA transferase/CoA:oxalate CoA-transferase